MHGLEVRRHKVGFETEATCPSPKLPPIAKSEALTVKSIRIPQLEPQLQIYENTVRWHFGEGQLYGPRARLLWRRRPQPRSATGDSLSAVWERSAALERKMHWPLGPRRRGHPYR